jgi:hypothetical protein
MVSLAEPDTVIITALLVMASLAKPVENTFLIVLEVCAKGGHAPPPNS